MKEIDGKERIVSESKQIKQKKKKFDTYSHDHRK